MKTWLITGCSSGFGKSLAQAVLERGWNCIVTARKPEILQEFKNKYPKTSLILSLDVTDKESIQKAVDTAIKHYGKIDVVVNNAGYCLRGAVEECTTEEIMRQFDTNLFGPINVIKSVLPYMRKEKEGAIINISSVAAFAASEGSAYYGSSKAALESLSDGLRKEVTPLGIKVMIVEPGPFKSNFYNRSIEINETNIEDYKNTAAKRKVKLDNLDASVIYKWGDTDKAASAIIKAISGETHPYRLLLGSFALNISDFILNEKRAELDLWRDLSVVTDLE